MTLSEPPVTHEPGTQDSRTNSTIAVCADQDEAHRGFSRSVAVSGVRCILTYLVFPFLFPTTLGTLGPVLGLAVGSIALAANGFSIRRFWRANHAWRKPITVVHLGVIVLLVFLMARDIQELIS